MFWDKTTWDITTWGKTFCGQNILWTKCPEAQNVHRKKRPQGQNVLETKHSLDKTSSRTKYHQGQNVLRKNILIHWGKRPTTMIRRPTTDEKKWSILGLFSRIGTVKHIWCYISVSILDMKNLNCSDVLGKEGTANKTLPKNITFRSAL